MDPPMGALNVPVTCAGVTVNPGDIIIADESGVLCMSRERAAEIADAARTKEATSTARREDLRSGIKLGAATGADARVAQYCIQGGLA
jgi:4-hydroxy-4-methyl-2-oxoglutarate aldolase